MAGAFVKPNDMMVYSYDPYRVTKAVLGCPLHEHGSGGNPTSSRVWRTVMSHQLIIKIIDPRKRIFILTGSLVDRTVVLD